MLVRCGVGPCWAHTRVGSGRARSPPQEVYRAGLGHSFDRSAARELARRWNGPYPSTASCSRSRRRTSRGHALSSEAIWDGRPWKREWLLEALADLKSCRFARFTDNFVRFNATPGNIGWADNARWSALADKAGHCAWLMRQSGGKGLAIDFESYGAQQFRFDPGQGRTFADTAALARKRGAQFTRAVAREFPTRSCSRCG